MSDEAAIAKEQGVIAFKAKNYELAIQEFEKAINLTPSDHTLYGNASAAYFNLNNFEDALRLADKCIEVNPAWSKGYQRRGMALASLQKIEEAKEAYTKALELDPGNAQIQASLEELTPPGEGAGNSMFPPEAMAKLLTHSKTKDYFKDPDFQAKFEFCKTNPQMMMQFMQMDKRFMDCFEVMTGINLSDLQQKQYEAQSKADDIKYQKDKERKERDQKEEEERKKKEAEDNMTDEEKSDNQQHKVADEWKDRGNAAYKALKFDEAIELYDQAISIYPSDLTYYTNKAAVYFQMKDYTRCVEI